MVAVRLQDLLKHTPEDHPDHPLLLDAQRNIKQVAERINKGVRHAEEAERHARVLQEIEAHIEGMEEVRPLPAAWRRAGTASLIRVRWAANAMPLSLSAHSANEGPLQGPGSLVPGKGWRLMRSSSDMLSPNPTAPGSTATLPKAGDGH